ncbi:hypothetical protein ADUPG1_002544, partial [Aduncisulcus paluster]
MDITGDSSITGDLVATGNITSENGIITFHGASITHSGTNTYVTLDKDLYIEDTLLENNDTDGFKIYNNLVTTGSLTVNSLGMDVTGDSSITGDLDVTGSIGINTVTLSDESGVLTSDKDLTIQGSTLTLDSLILSDVAGTLDISTDVDISGDLVATGNITAESGVLTFNDAILSHTDSDTYVSLNKDLYIEDTLLENNDTDGFKIHNNLVTTGGLTVSSLG